MVMMDLIVNIILSITSLAIAGYELHIYIAKGRRKKNGWIYLFACMAALVAALKF